MFDIARTIFTLQADMIHTGALAWNHLSTMGAPGG